VFPLWYFNQCDPHRHQLCTRGRKLEKLRVQHTHTHTQTFSVGCSSVCIAFAWIHLCAYMCCVHLPVQVVSAGQAFARVQLEKHGLSGWRCEGACICPELAMGSCCCCISLELHSLTSAQPAESQGCQPSHTTAPYFCCAALYISPHTQEAYALYGLLL